MAPEMWICLSVVLAIVLVSMWHSATVAHRRSQKDLEEHRLAEVVAKAAIQWTMPYCQHRTCNCPTCAGLAEKAERYEAHIYGEGSNDQV